MKQQMITLTVLGIMFSSQSFAHHSSETSPISHVVEHSYINLGYGLILIALTAMLAVFLKFKS